MIKDFGSFISELISNGQDEPHKYNYNFEGVVVHPQINKQDLNRALLERMYQTYNLITMK